MTGALLFDIDGTLLDTGGASDRAWHRAFLERTRVAARWHNYLFVHAGVNPERPLSRQRRHDLMWIREPFLKATHEWGCRIVHGHVIGERPVVRANRIGVDTGAYETDVLTCAVLERAEEPMFLCTKPG